MTLRKLKGSIILIEMFPMTKLFFQQSLQHQASNSKWKCSISYSEIPYRFNSNTRAIGLLIIVDHNGVVGKLQLVMLKKKALDNI